MYLLCQEMCLLLKIHWGKVHKITLRFYSLLEGLTEPTASYYIHSHGLLQLKDRD